MKKVKSTVVGGSEAVVAVGNEMGSCRMDVGGVDGARAVAEVAVTTEVDVAVFFADFFLLDGAGIVSQAEYRWECVVGLGNNFDRVRMRRVGQQHVGRL